MAIEWRFHPYITLTLISAGVALLTAFYSWQRRSKPGAFLLTLMMLAVVIWSLGLGFEIGGKNMRTLLLAWKLSAPGIYTLPVLWLLFALQYTGHKAWLRPRRILLFMVIPALSLVLLWTSNWHNWFFSDLWTIVDQPLQVEAMLLRSRPGLGYSIYLIYANSLLLLATYFMVVHGVLARGLFRRQSQLLLLAMGLPWLTILLYLVNVLPPTLPLAPAAFALSGVLLAWDLFAYRLLDIIPVARDLLVEQMRDAVIVLDGEERIVDMNPTAQQLMPVMTGSSIGASASKVLPPPLYNMLATAKGEREAVVTLPTANGEQWYDVQLSPLRHGAQLQGWLLLLHDVTALHRATQRAEAADAAKSQFVSNVNHELRTPLTNIKLYIDLLRRNQGHKREQYLSILSREAERLHELIEDILYISRLDLDQAQLNLQEVDVNQLIQTLVEDRQLLFTQQGLSLSLETEPLPLIRADPKLLGQVATNLLTNALNYTQEGGVTVYTALVTRDAARWVTVAFQDTGLGIPEQEQEHLFERFYRGQSSLQAQVPGTGLGLAISQAIMKSHAGYITCQSAVGQGSTFTLWLPLPVDDAVQIFS